MKIDLSKIIIVILILVAVFMFLDRSCTHKKLNKALGEVDKQKEVTAAAELKADEAIAREEETKILHNEEIKKLTGSINVKDKKIKEKDTKIADLEKEEETLTDAPSLIANLRAQIELWKGNFTLSQQQVAELGVPYEVEIDGKMIMKYPHGSVTFNLNEKYLSQIRVTDQWIVKYDAQFDLSNERDNALKECMKDIKGIRFMSKIKTGGMIFAGTYGAAYFLGADTKISLIAGAVTTAIYLIF